MRNLCQFLLMKNKESGKLKLIIEMSGIEAKDAMSNGSLSEFIAMNISETKVETKKSTVKVIEKEEPVAKKQEVEKTQAADRSEETQSSKDTTEKHTEVESKYDFTEVQKILSKVAAAGHGAKIQGLIKDCGVDTLSAVPVSEYENLVKEAKVLING